MVCTKYNTLYHCSNTAPIIIAWHLCPAKGTASAGCGVRLDVKGRGIFSGFCKGCPILFHGTSVAHQGLWGGVSSTGPPDAGQGPHARWLRFRLVHVRLLGLFKNDSMPCKKRSGPHFNATLEELDQNRYRSFANNAA